MSFERGRERKSRQPGGEQCLGGGTALPTASRLSPTYTGWNHCIRRLWRFIAVLSEVAAVGQGRLQINEPGTSRSLKNLPGDLECPRPGLHDPRGHGAAGPRSGSG